eukprot:scaffold11_cov248-Chaetoceros_neogracile.AAC.21
MAHGIPSGIKVINSLLFFLELLLHNSNLSCPTRFPLICSPAFRIQRMPCMNFSSCSTNCSFLLHLSLNLPTRSFIGRGLGEEFFVVIRCKFSQHFPAILRVDSLELRSNLFYREFCLFRLFCLDGGTTIILQWIISLILIFFYPDFFLNDSSLLLLNGIIDL